MSNPKAIELTITGGETKWVEFKATVPPDQVIAKLIAAFANTEGGIILFRVGDKGTVIGISEDRLLGSPVDLWARQGKSLIYLSVAQAPDSIRARAN